LNALIFTRSFYCQRIAHQKHKTIETTDIMLQMVASGRGVAALPGWLVAEYASKMQIAQVRLGKQGIAKQIFWACGKRIQKSIT
jgi:LysR family transcriptional regulator for metE and metH